MNTENKMNFIKEERFRSKALNFDDRGVCHG